MTEYGSICLLYPPEVCFWTTMFYSWLLVSPVTEELLQSVVPYHTKYAEVSILVTVWGGSGGITYKWFKSPKVIIFAILVHKIG